MKRNAYYANALMNSLISRWAGCWSSRVPLASSTPKGELDCSLHQSAEVHYNTSIVGMWTPKWVRHCFPTTTSNHPPFLRFIGTVTAQFMLRKHIYNSVNILASLHISTKVVASDVHFQLCYAKIRFHYSGFSLICPKSNYTGKHNLLGAWAILAPIFLHPKN